MQWDTSHFALQIFIELIFFLLWASNLPNYRTINYDSIFNLSSGVTCNWCIQLDAPQIIALNWWLTIFRKIRGFSLVSQSGFISSKVTGYKYWVFRNLTLKITCHMYSCEERIQEHSAHWWNKLYVCIYPGCKTLFPKIVACEGPLKILTGAQEKERACPLIRSNTVCVWVRLKKWRRIPILCHQSASTAGYGYDLKTGFMFQMWVFACRVEGCHGRQLSFAAQKVNIPWYVTLIIIIDIFTKARKTQAASQREVCHIFKLI